MSWRACKQRRLKCEDHGVTAAAAAAQPRQIAIAPANSPANSLDTGQQQLHFQLLQLALSWGKCSNGS